MKEINYEQDIIIDDTALDLEWLEQSTLMMKYSRHAAKCRMLLDNSKQDLDIAKAEVDLDIRKNPEKYKLEKVTEAAIQGVILTTDKYKNAYEAYANAKFEYDIAIGAVNAFEQRKSALENLVKLHGQQYFAGPKLPRDLTSERAKKKERDTEVNDEIANGLNKRKFSRK